MPKKFSGENTKAAVAKARKAAVKEEEMARKLKAEEDKAWQDNDKHIIKKQQRQVEKEKKKQELLQKKQELKALIEIESKQDASVLPIKILRKDIIKDETNSKIKRDKNPDGAVENMLIENLNRMNIEEEYANNIDEAIHILSNENAIMTDKHPEKRLKAAYIAFESERLPKLKQEHPNLRLSQVKQLLKKEWVKSPSNPLNNL